MFYTIIKPFSEADGYSWISYCKWRGIQFEGFDSIDGLLRPSLFEPTTEEDWNHVSTQHDLQKYKYIIDFDYACQKHKEIGSGSLLLGLSFDKHKENDSGFLGYDLIDGYYDVSLLTNWGNDNAVINQRISYRGLVSSYEVIQEIQEHLIEVYGNDAHVEGCYIVSIYSTGFRVPILR